jgi:hypothetical protein
MRPRLKWLLVGFGFMFGLQLLIGQAVRLFASANVPQNTTYIMIAGATLAAFLVGGFVMGLMLNEVVLVEPVVAALAALGLNALLSSLGISNDALFFGESLVGAERSLSWALMIAAIAIVSAIAGALIGERVHTPESNWVSNVLLIAGLIAVVVGPYVLLIGHVPFYILAVVGLIFLVVVAIAYWSFTREPRAAEEMSIRPETHRK